MRCSRKLVKYSKIPVGYLWTLGLAAVGMALLTLPDLVKQHDLQFRKGGIIKGLQATLDAEEPTLREKDAIRTYDLVAQLEEADQQWQPREEILPDGSSRYLYKRRADEPDLSVSQLKQMIESPPSFHREREQILQLLQALQQAGVKVFLAPTLKQGAAAEWDHHLGILRIQPKITKKGSVDFLKVLNHEAIHVAQSCKAGALNQRPKPLGLSLTKTEILHKRLKDPIYAGASSWEQTLEMEAYGAQDNSDQVKRILASECKLAVNMAN